MEKRIAELEEELYLLYSSKNNKSNPTIFSLVETIIDDLTRLSSLLLDDSLSNANNPELIFLDWMQNVLGNPQSIRFRDSRTIIRDEHLSELCLEFCKCLINLSSLGKVIPF